MLRAVFLARQAMEHLHVDVYISIKQNPCHKIKYKVDPAVPCSRKPRSQPPPPLPRFSIECFRNRRQCHSTQDVQGMPECRLPGPHPSHRQACLLPMPPTYSRPRVHHTPGAYGRGHQTRQGCPSCRRFLGTTLQSLLVPNHTARFAAAATAMLGRAPRDKPRTAKHE